MSHPEPGVELLERALAYTRVALRHVHPAHLHRATPCAGWDLDHLLDHLHDALEAFTEGAHGTIAVTRRARALEVRVAALQGVAAELLGAWSAPGTPSLVVVGGLPLPTGLVSRVAAVEVATHGWDIAQTTGRATPLPPALARALLPVAETLVGPNDRGDRFAAALRPRPGADPGERLLAFLGRAPGHRPQPCRTRPG
ncbi:TIGR03086 family metal-binding protein [Nocardioides rubriscoriae]|uniref:TIGR03086 family metal-binding protein n=1 Tax=Nocardioides rubriscoriae TaxID=642762 RepID=UPI0014793AC3|nr:TIGR03086 family metal-binding protein [Nocardioides rubriscoriae]